MLITLILSSFVSTFVHTSREPIRGIVTQTYAFMCNNTYLLEINITYHMVWILGYSNSLNISIKPIDPLPHTRVKAYLTVDKFSISKFLGYLMPQGMLNSSISLILAPPLLQMQGGTREIKQAQITILFIEPRCTFTAPIWFILTAFNTSLDVIVWTKPDVVDVNSTTSIYVELKNQTPEPLIDIELYIYVNKSLVDSIRIPSLEDIKIINIEYVPRKVGMYTVEAKVIYTSPYNIRQVSNATNIFIAKGRPSISLSANTTFTHVGKAILFAGVIEPKTSHTKVIELEVSTDGINWFTIGRIESTYSFSYIWTPTLPNIYYVRAMMLENNLFYSALSNIIVLVVEKIKPAISINVNWPYLEVGSKALIKVELSPPIVDTVEVLYRLTNESSWNKVISRINRETSSIELVLTKPGVYEVKAVVPENTNTYSSESNIIQLYVSNPKAKTTTLERSETLQIPYRTNIITIPLIISSIIIALLLLLIKRR